MPTQNVPSMTPVPAFPALSERAAGTYNSSALAFGTHMSATFNAELLAVANNVKYNADDAKGSADTAALSVIAAAAQEAAAASSASAAASSANAAAASAGGQLWVSGTTYAVGALVFSALTGRNYRRLIAGAGTTDPSLDSTNWRATLLDADTGMPAIRPSLLLDFANSRTIDPRISVTRPSAATRVNERGVIETVAANVPRIDFDPVTLACRGWLIEEQRTNLVTYSEQFDNAAWEKFGTTVTPNLLVAPDGSLTADKVVESTANSEHYVRSPAISCTAGTYVASVYWHTSSERNLYLRVVHPGEASATSQVTFDKSALVLGHVTGNAVSASAQNVGNGWWRISLVFSITATRNVQHGCQPYSTSTSYTGDGTSGIYVWGSQLEAGTLPTSYIPTTTAAVTRAAEVGSMTGSNFSSWYRQDEGAFVCTFDSTGSTGTAVPFGVATTGVFNESMYVSRQADGGVFSNVIDNGISQFSTIGLGTAASGVAFNVAVAYKLNDSAAVGNGSALVTDNSCTLPTVDRLSIGHSPWNQSTGHLNGHIRRLAFFTKRLSNTELQALTTP